MIPAVRAEWTKLRTVSSTAWTALSIVVATVGIGALAAFGLRTAECGVGTCDATRATLSGVYLGQVAVVVLAVLALAPEYDTRMIHTTLAAEPRRWRVLTAKAGVSTLIALVGGAVSVLGSLITGRIILSGKDFGPVSDGLVLRAYVGTVLYCGLIAVLSLAIATILRHTAASVTVVLAMLYTMPIIAALVTDPLWRTWLLRLSPMTAGLAIQATIQLDALPIAPWRGLGLLFLYTAGMAAVAAVLFEQRDA